ncbi:cytochrome c biogenesis protein CcdC [Cytobacillus sp. S13-E01]|uniref:CcdC family protein n=1 Tax=Cytobacillus sp. S13-E01 TaxID=3031326 RepID=UPI0023D879C9|nr:cytochrome c biogenesis protein CcdC [Cytobacillus sp. S13-E01]MDF0728016.1 cytochrome c biogenesis protein CcdC [Cytobacillus sp. S13-E01]
MVIASSVVAVIMAILVIFVRIRASKRPTTARKIILPPIFMSTGALMFLHPMFRVTPLEVIEALLVGLLFSLFLIKTSNFEIKENEIYLKRSKAFIFILLGLLIIRIILKSVLSTTIDVGELSGMFWILAFGMIVPWRIAMFYRFKKLETEIQLN